MDKQILIPSAPILVESTRSIGYSFETAVADIIDNSISKNADEIFVYFDAEKPQYLVVLDNGSGMTKDELIEAMKYGSRSSIEERDIDDLGRFGLGLKMASLSQCRRLTVISKKNNIFSGAVWDLDHIVKCEEWELLILNEQEIKNIRHFNMLDSFDSGTIVLWENFDRINKEEDDHVKIFNNKITITRAHLSLVFHRFLAEDKKINLYLNNEAVQPADPFFTYHKATQQLVEERKEINGYVIKIRPYILPYISKLNEDERKQIYGIDGINFNQGFYIYRNKRLIIWGTWFRLTAQHELKQLTRIRIDIPNTMDSLWEIDVKKSTASIPEALKKILRNIVEKSVIKSEKVYKYRGRDINKDDVSHLWRVIEERDKKIKYHINKEHSLCKAVFNHLDEEGREYFEMFLKSAAVFFPYNDVYVRLSKKHDSIKTENIEDDKLYMFYRSFIQTIDENDIEEFINSLQNDEIIINRKEIINKLIEDFKDVRNR